MKDFPRLSDRLTHAGAFLSKYARRRISNGQRVLEGEPK
jgi:hypothetical protein